TRRIQNPLPSGVAVQVRLPVPYLNDKASTKVGALLFLNPQKEKKREGYASRKLLHGDSRNSL
ncbi:hypothetical protein, partial [Vibrio sp. 10N.261.49.A11]|uniref:hypothetical protein n=1 Tax=Vibrio sp. 10N.261.49.A11 TaxID=3229666 RepID=UPI0035512888